MFILDLLSRLLSALPLLKGNLFFPSQKLHSMLSEQWWYLPFYCRQTKVAMVSGLKRRKKYWWELMLMSTSALSWKFLSSFGFLKCHPAHSKECALYWCRLSNVIKSQFSQVQLIQYCNNCLVFASGMMGSLRFTLPLLALSHLYYYCFKRETRKETAKIASSQMAAVFWWWDQSDR